MNDSILNSRELEFAIFCIENIALRLNTKPQKIYLVLAEQSDILNNYIVANYDILHYWRTKLYKAGFKTVIIDEVQYIKNRHGSEQSESEFRERNVA